MAKTTRIETGKTTRIMDVIETCDYCGWEAVNSPDYVMSGHEFECRRDHHAHTNFNIQASTKYIEDNLGEAHVTGFSLAMVCADCGKEIEEIEFNTEQGFDLFSAARELKSRT